MNRFKNQKGFTLIELLVVVAIIGILSSIVFASLTSAKEKARDAKRKADIREIQIYLESYYSANGTYPIFNWTSSNNSTSWNALGATLGVELPVDPTNTATGHAHTGGVYTYSYFDKDYGCEGQWYMLVYRLEKNSNPVSPGVRSCTQYFNYPGTMTVGANNAM